MNYFIRQNDNWFPVANFHRELDGLFGDFLAPSSVNRRDAEHTWTPACDVSEADGNYLLAVEMPGIAKEDIKIELTDNTLVISGERRFENKAKAGGSWYGERRYGKFQRSFTLPPGTVGEKVEANYQDGVLHLILPKAEDAKPRQIKISDRSNTLEHKANQKDKVA